MIGKTVAGGPPVSTYPLPTPPGSSNSGVPATTLNLQPASPMSVGGPLQALQPTHALPAQPLQAVAGQVQAPQASGMARARSVINDFVTAVCRNVPGSDARRRYLAAEAPKLEKSLNEAIDAAKATVPMAGKTNTELIGLLTKAIDAHYALSQWKGTDPEDEVKLLQTCMDMHDHLQQAIAPHVIHMEDIRRTIGRKAHAIYFKMATGVGAQRGFDGFELAGTPCKPAEVNLLACARAAYMNSHAQVGYRKLASLPLADLYHVSQLQDLPLTAPLDGNALTKREIDMWCADPPQNPWPVEPRLLRFYEAAKHAAQGVRRREELVEHLPTAQLPPYDDRAQMAELIAGFAGYSQEEDSP